MAVTTARPWDTTPADEAASAHGRHQQSSRAPTAGVMNAFAATLAATVAAMLTPALPLRTTAAAADAASELDASAAPATAETPGASPGPSPAASPGALPGALPGVPPSANGAAHDGTPPAGTPPDGTPPARAVSTGDAPAPPALPASGMSGAPGASGVANTGGTSGGDPRPVYAAAAEARATVNGAPVTAVSADADALNPEFRARLNRVITRMHDELGHDVELVEGYRPQSRQDFLYAQGRTRPGPVVTWTRSSKHSLGLAADLKIDGSYANPAAYQQLARIAAQEGLRTLGPRDPGHVELPDRGGAAAWGASTDRMRIDENVSRALELALANDGTGDAGDGRQAQSDTDGINGLLSRATRGSAVSAPGAASYGGSSASFGNGFGSGFGNGFTGAQHSQESQGSGREPQRATRVDGATLAQPGQPAAVAQVAQVADVAQVAQVAQVAVPGSAIPAGAHQSTHASAADVAPPLTGALSAARVGHLLDVRDATPAQPLSHVTLDLDNTTGGSDRITVQLRSGAVDTSIALGDSSRADRMSLRVGELQHALEQHGLETGTIQVAQTGTDTSAGWTPRQGGDQRGADQRPTPNHRDHRQDADDARQRSRREPQGRRQQ